MDLTTLARAKAMLSGGVGSIPADPMIQGLIAMASDAAVQFCSRTFQRATMANLLLNGSGTSRLMMPSNPIIAVTGPILVDGYSYSQAPTDSNGFGFNTAAAGYGWDRKFLYMFGGCIFRQGYQNVQIPSLTIGYTTSETGTIPNSNPATIIPRQGSMVDLQGQPMSTAGYAFADKGVVFTATGVALTLVSGTPATGQYAFSDGVYTFAQVDNGKQVKMSYDFVPASVELAVVETVGAKLRNQQNYGIRSRTIGQETVTYSDMALSKSAQNLLQPYRWVVQP